jgi:hypothetical protein
MAFIPSREERAFAGEGSPPRWCSLAIGLPAVDGEDEGRWLGLGGTSVVAPGSLLTKAAESPYECFS